MIRLLLKRIALRDDYTIGKLYIDGSYFCDTLEDRVRDLAKEAKVPAKTAIPSGTYKVMVNTSPKFKRLLPRLLDVPHFDGILIHRGNTPEDTAGCILVGENKQIGKVLNSTYYEERLVEILKTDRNITIEIK
jgi:hypothetical protein